LKNHMVHAAEIVLVLVNAKYGINRLTIFRYNLSNWKFSFGRRDTKWSLCIEFRVFFSCLPYSFVDVSMGIFNVNYFVIIIVSISCFQSFYEKFGKDRKETFLARYLVWLGRSKYSETSTAEKVLLQFYASTALCIQEGAAIAAI